MQKKYAPSDRSTSTPASVLSAQAFSDLAGWINETIWLEGCDLVTELGQARDEGRDLTTVESEFARLIGTPAGKGQDTSWHFVRLGGARDEAWLRACGELVDRVQTLPFKKDRPWIEPSDFAGIRATRPRPEAGAANRVWRGSRREFERRLHGGLAGRIAGCMLGKPVEGWNRWKIETIVEVLHDGALRGYLRAPNGAQKKKITRLAGGREQPFYAADNPCLADNLRGAVSDDDINYTLIGHEVVRRHGADFRPWQVGRVWLGQLPLMATCTAERVAYRNLAAGALPPASATFRNPYREWIGAQIRADYFGYANPGDPARAAAWAWRDASISHTGNGIYGEMWVAASLAVAYAGGTWPEILRAGLAQVPVRSRLRAAVEEVLALHASGADLAEFKRRFDARWDAGTGSDRAREWAANWVHTLPNAQIVAAALLWGGDDFGGAVGTAVALGADTDCNGATVGSLWGVRHGYDAIPRAWLDPLADLCRSGVGEARECSIAALAEKMARTALAAHG